jgi:hypothetical protein
MAIPRKRALERLGSFAVRVEEHLAKIAANPGHSSVPHWGHEVRNWLEQMEEMLRHVGKKTSGEWQPRIQAYRAAPEE